MPIPASRVASCLGALSATVIVGGICAGSATAGPDGQADTGRASQPSKGNLIGSTLGAVGAMTRGHGSAQPIHTVLGIPSAVVGVPKAVVGTAQVTTARTVAVVNAHLPTVKKGPVKAPDTPAPAEVPAPVDAAVDAAVSTDVAVAVPAPPLPVPVPPPVPPLPAIPVPVPLAFVIPVPATPFTPATVYSVDLSSPVVAYSTVRDTYETTNTLATEAVQPYNPFRAPTPDPEPEPEPQVKVYERQDIAEAPPVDVSGAPSPAGSGGTDDLSVVRMPMVVPAAAVRLAPPRPFSEATPPAAAPDGLVGGGAVPVVRGSDALVGGAAAPPVVRGSQARTGPQGTETPLEGVTSPIANSPVRQGFSPNLRNARMVELTTVALPGLAGLLGLTVSGGFIGYRQATAVRYLRADVDRFMT